MILIIQHVVLNQVSFTLFVPPSLTLPMSNSQISLFSLFLSFFGCCCQAFGFWAQKLGKYFADLLLNKWISTSSFNVSSTDLANHFTDQSRSFFKPSCIFFFALNLCFIIKSSMKQMEHKYRRNTFSKVQLLLHSKHNFSWKILWFLRVHKNWWCPFLMLAWAHITLWKSKLFSHSA